MSLIHDDWCWKHKTIDVDIASKDLADVVFEQNGYVLSVSASHDLRLVSNKLVVFIKCSLYMCNIQEL